jgi:SNF2 family DNA or RNA helicase
MQWTPKPYQLQAVKFLLQNCNAGIFLDPGMGKTSTTLATIAHLRKTGHVARVLIIAPIRPMYKVWPDEIRKWDDFRHLACTILHGDNKEDNLNKISDIYLINPEGLKWFVQSGGMAKLKPDMLVVDESTKFKDYSTARFKLLKPWLKTFKRRVILTGEPAPNGYMDLFGQCYIMDQGASLGRFITHYRAQFFYPSGFGGFDWTLRKGAAEEIQALIAPHVIRLDARDHLDMPELMFNDIKVDLPPEARAIYKQFEDDFLATVGDNKILLPNAAAVGSKCRQVANGGVYDEDHFAHPIHDVKTQALVDLVEQLQGNPVFVGYEFKHDLDRILRAFPKAPCLTGMTGNKLDQVIDAFNRGDIPVLLAHPASAGHGLNLQEACHTVCFYGLTWDLDLYHQFYKRIWRQGQKSERVIVHRILADKTLDQTVARTLLGKDATQQAFLEAIKSGSATDRTGQSTT